MTDSEHSLPCTAPGVPAQPPATRVSISISCPPLLTRPSPEPLLSAEGGCSLLARGSLSDLSSVILSCWPSSLVWLSVSLFFSPFSCLPSLRLCLQLVLETYNVPELSAGVNCTFEDLSEMDGLVVGSQIQCISPAAKEVPQIITENGECPTAPLPAPLLPILTPHPASLLHPHKKQDLAAESLRRGCGKPWEGRRDAGAAQQHIMARVV